MKIGPNITNDRSGTTCPTISPDTLIGKVCTSVFLSFTNLTQSWHSTIPCYRHLELEAPFPSFKLVHSSPDGKSLHMKGATEISSPQLRSGKLLNHAANTDWSLAILDMCDVAFLNSYHAMQTTLSFCCHLTQGESLVPACS